MSSRLDQIAALTDKQQVAYRDARIAGRNIDDSIAYALQSSRTLDRPKTKAEDQK
jgi:hypothetical protein